MSMKNVEIVNGFNSFISYTGKKEKKREKKME